ncbi:hypothetical protein ABZ791_37735 [Streptomyces huasconensis]|uniref:Uncharacterized protein n=1 Tax=Streptomyces huasconensis TaxID=1854574 RepID=A0ABV3M790_9ACTN
MDACRVPGPQRGLEGGGGRGRARVVLVAERFPVAGELAQRAVGAVHRDDEPGRGGEFGVGEVEAARQFLSEADQGVVDAGDSEAAEPSWPLTTWQGWYRFAITEPPAPPQPDDPPRSTEERLAYHSAFVTIRPPAISQLATQVRTLMTLGRHQQTTTRPSLIVTGPAAAGKTTALLNVGRTCHLAQTRKSPPPPGSAHAAAPVAYVLVPPGATAKTLITEFARYLAIPVATRTPRSQRHSILCDSSAGATVCAHLDMFPANAAPKASTSLSVVSNEHIRRTSPRLSSLV